MSHFICTTWWCGSLDLWMMAQHRSISLVLSVCFSPFFWASGWLFHKCMLPYVLGNTNHGTGCIAWVPLHLSEPQYDSAMPEKLTLEFELILLSQFNNSSMPLSNFVHVALNHLGLRPRWHSIRFLQGKQVRRALHFSEDGAQSYLRKVKGKCSRTVANDTVGRCYATINILTHTKYHVDRETICSAIPCT